ncbi:MAG: amidase [Clostridia bacterium]|nr:amidase [Clostridia bacterium]
MNFSNRLETLSAAELGQAVKSGQISPAETVDYFAQRIEKRNPGLNAFVYTKFEEARKAAKTLETRLAHGEDPGPFAGVPFGLKDFLPSKKGWTNSHGGVRALIRQDPFDSEFCRAMEAAGGIAVGKTNAPAFAFRGTCDNKLYGPTSTPFALGYNSGGSSGGSAAAVADGLVPIAEGSDGGGSIRIPAAWCGIFGFKASVGTIPSVCRPDAWAATHPYCFNGGLTRTVEDSAILLNYMARHDPRDPLSLPRTEADYTKHLNRSLKGWRIGYTPDFGVFPTEPEITETVERAVLRFAESGAVVEPVSFSFRHCAVELAECWCRSICADTAIELELWRREGLDLVRDHRDELPDGFVYWNQQIARGGIMDYYDFNCIRTELYDALQTAFEDFDLIVSPTTACLPVRNRIDGNTMGPPSICGIETEPLIGFCQTFFANFTGHPAASLPAGLSQSGLPIGMQLIGRRFCDADLLAAAACFERIQPWKALYEIPYSRTLPDSPLQK